MLIDLSANECPYPPSDKVANAVLESLGQLNRYGAPQQLETLKHLLAEFADCQTESIFIGHGTDAVLAPILTHFSPNRTIIVTSPTSFGNLGLVRASGGKLKRLQLSPPDFKLNWANISTGRSLLLLSQPSAPAGKCLISRQQLTELLEDNKNGNENLVVIDEAGFDYCEETVMDLVAIYPNLAVTRTLDKAFGLAGLRISWMSAGKTFLAAFQQSAPSVGRVACAAAIAALEDPAYAKAHATLTISERGRLTQALKALGFEVFDSKANFLLVKSSVPELGLHLRQHGILIKDFSGFWLDGYYQITVGSQAENDALIKAIKLLQI